jgi:hypothetical protein
MIVWLVGPGCILERDNSRRCRIIVLYESSTGNPLSIRVILICLCINRKHCNCVRKEPHSFLSSALHTMVFLFISFHFLSYTVASKVPQQAWVALVSVGIIAGCAYPVFKTDSRPGHELFSSEKPEAVHESQEARRKEYRRLIKEQQAKIQQDHAVMQEESNATPSK